MHAQARNDSTSWLTRLENVETDEINIRIIKVLKSCFNWITNEKDIKELIYGPKLPKYLRKLKREGVAIQMEIPVDTFDFRSPRIWFADNKKRKPSTPIVLNATRRSLNPLRCTASAPSRQSASRWTPSAILNDNPFFFSFVPFVSSWLAHNNNSRCFPSSFRPLTNVFSNFFRPGQPGRSGRVAPFQFLG